MFTSHILFLGFLTALGEPAAIPYRMEYKFKQIPENRKLKVKYGSIEHSMKMDMISNSPFEPVSSLIRADYFLRDARLTMDSLYATSFKQAEFARWKAMMQESKVLLPLRSELAEKKAVMRRMIAKPITDVSEGFYPCLHHQPQVRII